MKEKNNLLRSMVGAPSIMLIIVVIGMSIFAMLALRSCLNEQRLATKAAEATKDYYRIESMVETSIAQIDDILAKENADNIINKINDVNYVTAIEYNEEIKSYIITLLAAIDSDTEADASSLELNVRISFSKATGKISVLEWRTSHKPLGQAYEIPLPD